MSLSFTDFALEVYPFLELQPFHRVYYRVLEAFARGRIPRLIVTMPPQRGKRVGATTLLPAHPRGRDPARRAADPAPGPPAGATAPAGAPAEKKKKDGGQEPPRP